MAKFISMVTPSVGDSATHRSGRLDARRVTKVSKDHLRIWLAMPGGGQAGPFHARDYVFKREVRS